MFFLIPADPYPPQALTDGCPPPCRRGLLMRYVLRGYGMFGPHGSENAGNPDPVTWFDVSGAQLVPRQRFFKFQFSPSGECLEWQVPVPMVFCFQA